MKATKKLTDTQRDFAAQNHDLVFQYLRMKGLNVDEFYDVVILRYLRAVQLYDERPELRKYTFQTIAFQNMRSALGHYFEAMARQKRSAVVLSLNAVGANGLELSEAVAAPIADVCEYAEVKEKWDTIKQSVTPKQMRVLEMRAHGYTNREIGKVFYLTPSAVSRQMGRLRRKSTELAA